VPVPTNNVAEARIEPYCLPLRRPWVAAAATLTERTGALLRITTADGFVGWGDCAPLPSSGAAGHERVFAALAEHARRLHANGESGLRRLASAEYSGSFSDIPPEVRWASETALLDIAAQRQGVPLARRLDSASVLQVAVNAALGPLDAGCAARAESAIAQGYAIGKIKVGIDAIDVELARLRALVDSTAGRLRLRLDANRAWPEATARRFLAASANLPIDSVEEPLAAPTLPALAALQADLPFAIAIDESLPQLGADALIAARAVRRFVLKPARIGGFAATQAIARLAAAAGIEVVLTSVVDSAIGVTAAAHLAAALSPTLAHGLGTSAWLAADVAAPLSIIAGKLQLLDTPGLGLRPV
jgi:o-succinylbenzoate synthase